MKEYIITERQILEANYSHGLKGGNQWLLKRLQDQGAPIDGDVHLEENMKDYSWENSRDVLTGDMIFRVTKKT